ncbi:MAG: hypothetical protein IPN44_04200 [Flavobacteriales bacterium]|nr:hypothetical protein [Flavobacteriales bacterium]
MIGQPLKQNTMMKMRTGSVLTLLAAALLWGCTKEAGDGGKAEITGTVLRQDVNAGGSPLGAPYPFQEARVYIVYGDHATYDDDIRTGPDGKYSFRWLRKGDYTLYTYSECNCPGKTEALSAKVTVGDNKDVVTVPVFTALNY